MERYMTVSELSARIVAAKSFLNAEIVKIRTNGSQISTLNYREIGSRLDMIHEVERVGVRHLGDLQLRRISRVVDELDIYRSSAN